MCWCLKVEYDKGQKQPIVSLSFSLLGKFPTTQQNMLPQVQHSKEPAAGNARWTSTGCCWVFGPCLEIPTVPEPCGPSCHETPRHPRGVPASPESLPRRRWRGWWPQRSATRAFQVVSAFWGGPHPKKYFWGRIFLGGDRLCGFSFKQKMVPSKKKTHPSGKTMMVSQWTEHTGVSKGGVEGVFTSSSFPAVSLHIDVEPALSEKYSHGGSHCWTPCLTCRDGP